MLLFAFPGSDATGAFLWEGKWEMWETMGNGKMADAHLRVVPEARARASFLTNYNKEVLFA